MSTTPWRVALAQARADEATDATLKSVISTQLRMDYLVPIPNHAEYIVPCPKLVWVGVGRTFVKAIDNLIEDLGDEASELIAVGITDYLVTMLSECYDPTSEPFPSSGYSDRGYIELTDKVVAICQSLGMTTIPELDVFLYYETHVL